MRARTTAGIDAAPQGVRVTASLSIDLGALVANWRALAAKAPSALCTAVVKADAYGLGAPPAAKALADAGVRCFYVAWPEEGVIVRGAVGDGPEIAVFHGPDAETLPLFARAALEPVINTPEQLKLWLSQPQPAPYALHLDTGMSRLGLSPRDWGAAVQATSAHPPTTILSHLACGDEPGHPMNAHQLSAFREGAALWPGARRSLSATGGVLLGADYHFDEVRPGIGLYGGGPQPLSPVATLTAPILQLRDIQAGESAGYGATWTAQRPSRLATLGIGYADGFLRSSSNRGYGVIRGERRPIVGRVSMDLIMLDVTGLDVALGEAVEMLGPAMPLADAAANAGTIDYELLTRLGRRFQRTWTGA